MRISDWSSDVCSSDLEAGDGARRFLAPASLAALAELYATHPEATLTAGSTDVGLWVTKNFQRPETVIHTGRVTELQRIEETPEAISIGAGVTYADALALLARHYPDMGEVIRRLGSVRSEEHTSELQSLMRT